MSFNQNEIKDAEIYIRPEDYEVWGKMELVELEDFLYELRDAYNMMNDVDSIHVRKEIGNRCRALDYYITKKFYDGGDGNDEREGGVII